MHFHFGWEIFLNLSHSRQTKFFLLNLKYRDILKSPPQECSSVQDVRCCNWYWCIYELCIYMCAYIYICIYVHNICIIYAYIWAVEHICANIREHMRNFGDNIITWHKCKVAVSYHFWGVARINVWWQLNITLDLSVISKSVYRRSLHGHSNAFGCSVDFGLWHFKSTLDSEPFNMSCGDACVICCCTCVQWLHSVQCRPILRCLDTLFSNIA